MQETQRNQLVAPIEKPLPRFRCALALSQQIVPMQVTIDRPFFFVIRDRINGSAIFLGRVMSPPEAQPAPPSEGSETVGIIDL